jgi:hypothetical protein
MFKLLTAWRRPLLVGACLGALGSSSCGSSSSSTPAASGGASAPPASTGGSSGQASGSGGAAQASSSGGATAPSATGGTSGGGSGGATGIGPQGTGGGVAAATGGAPGIGGGASGGTTTTGGGGSGVSASGGSPATTGGGGAGTSNNPIMAGGDTKCATPMVAIGSLCDGFEGPAIGATGSPLMVDPMNGASTAVVDTTKAYRGTKSAHLKMASDRVFITESGTFNQTGSVAINNDMWGRIFIWVTAPMNPGGHTVFIRLEDPALAGMSKELHLAGENDGIFGAELRTTKDNWKMGSIMYPLATPKWECWEWHTTAANTLEFYIDGKIQTAMTVTAADAWPYPTFKKLSLGFLSFRGNANVELWIDEVAVGTSRVGCDN